MVGEFEEIYGEEIDEVNIAETTREATLKDVLIILEKAETLEEAKELIEKMKDSK